MGQELEMLVKEIRKLNIKIDDQNKKINQLISRTRNIENIALSGESYILDSLENAYSDLEIGYYDRVHSLLHVMQPIGFGFKRIGNERDGGYLLVDNFAKDNKGITYSFGISNDISFDDAISKQGYDVYMYDHTISGISSNNERLHYFKQGIGDADGKMDDKLNTLEYYLDVNGHNNASNMILKMDVEGAEWDFFKSVRKDTLKRFDQIVMEIHHFVGLRITADRIIKGLEKLNETHQLVWIHSNNYGVAKRVNGRIYTNAFEVCFLNKSNYNFKEPEMDYCDMKYDYPNWNMRIDFNMKRWNE